MAFVVLDIFIFFSHGLRGLSPFFVGGLLNITCLDGFKMMVKPPAMFLMLIRPSTLGVLFFV